LPNSRHVNDTRKSQVLRQFFHDLEDFCHWCFLVNRCDAYAPNKIAGTKYKPEMFKACLPLKPVSFRSKGENFALLFARPVTRESGYAANSAENKPRFPRPRE